MERCSDLTFDQETWQETCVVYPIVLAPSLVSLSLVSITSMPDEDLKVKRGFPDLAAGCRTDWRERRKREMK